MALKGMHESIELWKIGRRWWAVRPLDDVNPPVPLGWVIENNDDLQALVGPGGSASPARTYRSMSEAANDGFLDMGTRAELAEFVDSSGNPQDPLETFEQDYAEQAQALPMLQDPEVRALFAGAVMEGRQPTPEELTQTEWWQNRSEAEREWATLSLQDPKTAAQQRADRKRAVTQMLRRAGVSEAPDSLIDLLADKWASGRWTESMVTNQIAGIADPYAGIELSGEVIRAARDYDPTKGDAAALAGGRDAVRERVRAIFESPMRQVTIATEDETEDERLDRITDEVMDGRDIDDVRRSVDQQAGLHPLTGRDITREGEDEVRALAQRWLGPKVGNLSADLVRAWAGKLRNDPDAQTEFVESVLKPRRKSMLREYDENLTYEDIIEPVRNIAVDIWGQPIQDETMLVDLANMNDYTAMQERLYREGLRKGVTKVKQQFEQDVLAATGGSVRQSMV